MKAVKRLRRKCKYTSSTPTGEGWYGWSLLLNSKRTWMTCPEIELYWTHHQTMQLIEDSKSRVFWKTSLCLPSFECSKNSVILISEEWVSSKRWLNARWCCSSVAAVYTWQLPRKKLKMWCNSPVSDVSDSLVHILLQRWSGENWHFLSCSVFSPAFWWFWSP